MLAESERATNLNLAPEIIVASEQGEILERLGQLAFKGLSRDDNPFLRPAWLSAFIRHYGASRKLAFTFVYRKSELRLVVPFQLSSVSGSLTLSCDETADFSDVLPGCVDYSDDITAAMEHWFQNGVSRCVFSRLPMDSPTLGYLISYSLNYDRNNVVRVADIAPYLAIDRRNGIDWNRIRQSETVNRYFRKRRNLRGRTSTEFITSYDEFLQIWPVLREIHISRWNSIGVQSKYDFEERSSFILDIVNYFSNTGELFVPVLRIDGNLAAFIIGYRVKNRVYDWNTSFNIAYSKHSPGALLLIDVLEFCQNEEILAYDFLRGCEEHKFLWANKYYGNIEVSISR